MPIQKRKEDSQIVLLILLIIILDQTTKYLIKNFLPKGDSLPLIKNLLHLSYVQNFGSAFGIFKKGTVFFIFVSSIAIVFIILLFLYERSRNKRLRLSLAMILAGAVGNLIDRLKFGYVIDFIDIRIWPVFNIADSFITIGAIFLIYELLKKKVEQ